MAESATVLVDEIIPRVPVRQWVLSFPIALRILIAAPPELLTPVLRIIHRVIASFLLKQAGLKRATADTGAVTLIQRFGSAVNLNIHLHCLVFDGVYRRTEGVPVFQQARAPTGDELAAMLDKIIARLLTMLTRQGYLIEEEGVRYMADRDADNPLASLQAARMGWARLLKRVFEFDLEHCPQCGGDFKIIAVIEEPALIVKILTHLGLPARAPPRSPARPSASKSAPRGDAATDKPAREEDFRQTPRKLIPSRAVDTVAQGEKGGLKFLYAHLLADAR